MAGQSDGDSLLPTLFFASRKESDFLNFWNIPSEKRDSVCRFEDCFK